MTSHQMALDLGVNHKKLRSEIKWLLKSAEWKGVKITESKIYKDCLIIPKGVNLRILKVLNFKYLKGA